MTAIRLSFSLAFSPGPRVLVSFPTLFDPTVFHIHLPARSPPFATAFARSEHALVVGRHRRRRRRQRDYDEEEEEEEEAENDDSDALSISRVALEDRESEEFVCLLVSSAASKRQADLRSRTNDFAFRATGGWLLPNVVCLVLLYPTLPFLSHSPSLIFSYSQWLASRKRKREE